MWRARVGDYRIINPDDEYLVNRNRCMLVDGRMLDLQSRDRRSARKIVDAYSDDESYVFGYGRNVGDTTVAYRVGGRQRIRYSGFIFDAERAAGRAVAARWYVVCVKS